jgi:hypothetical protein
VPDILFVINPDLIHREVGDRQEDGDVGGGQNRNPLFSLDATVTLGSMTLIFMPRSLAAAA